MLEPLGSVSPLQKAIIKAKLAEAITNSGSYEALIRTDIDQLMKEFNFQEGGMVGDDQRKRLGRLSGAELMCITQLTSDGNYFFADCSLVELESGKIIKTANQLMSTSPTELEKGCVDLAAKLIGQGISASSGSSANNNSNHHNDVIVANSYGQKKTVAVIPAEGESVSQDIRIGVTNGLQEGVFNSGKYTLLARGKAFENALSEMKFQESGGAFSDDQLAEFGRAIGADFVCYATLSKYSETSYRISYKMINVASEKIVNMGSETVPNGVDGLLAVSDDIAKKLFDK